MLENCLFDFKNSPLPYFEHFLNFLSIFCSAIEDCADCKNCEKCALRKKSKSHISQPTKKSKFWD